MQEKYLILIGGAPTTGKSTVAQALSMELSIPWISSDQIREFSQELLSDQKEKYSELFNDTNFTAESFLNSHSASEIAKLEIKQSYFVFNLMNKFLNKSYPWKSFIIEGVNVLPEFLEQVRFDGRVVPIFLVDEDQDRTREVVYKRGLWGPAKSYSDDVKEKEVEWVFEFSKTIKESCKKSGLKYFEVSKKHDDIKIILDYVKFKLG